MNVSSCEDIIKLAHPDGTLSADLIHVILPNICAIIDKIPAMNVSFEERLFYSHCCDPIPSMILNKTVLRSENETDNSRLIEDVCAFMDVNGQNRDEALYKELCIARVILTSGVLNPAHRLLTFIVLSLLSPIGLFANILILLTVYKVKHLRNTTGYFICNLAIADLLVIFTMILFVVLNFTGGMESANGRVTTFFFPTLDVVIGSASLLHVTAVTIERGIAVSMPLKYPRYLNERTAHKMIVGIWGYCFLLLVLGLLRIAIKSTLYEDIFFFTAAILSFFIPCILVVVSYSFILVSAFKNMKMEKKISKVIVVIAMIDQENLEQIASMRPARFREIKIAFNVAIMTVPFVFGWGYFMGCNIYEVVSKNDISGFQNWLIPFVPFIISCVNPLTYLMFTRSLRKSSIQLISKSKLCKKLTQSLIRKENEITSCSFVINDRSSTCVESGNVSKRQSMLTHNEQPKKNSITNESSKLLTSSLSETPCVV